jgi:GntR family transcriptional regulator
MSANPPVPSDLRRFVPRYHEIEQALRAQIATLQPDDPLPSDSQLCTQFGVSRMTARNAVARLTQEGIVYRVPGRGTFVARSPLHRQASNLLSFSDEMRREGRVPSSRTLGQRLRPATPDERARLRLSQNAEVVVLTRLRLADGEPVALEGAVLNADTVDALASLDPDDGSLHRALVEFGRVPTAGTASIGAAVANAREAKLLEIRAGAPLLIECRLILDQAGDPLELTESRYVADRYGLEVGFDVELADS